jgi:hypothetical protein
MEPKHRIKIKLGNAEFEAEGEPDIVNKQYDDFMAALAALPKAPTASTPDDPKADPEEKRSGAATNHSKPSKEVLSRVFRQDEPLSLMDRPNTDNADADALLVLIYGHTELGNKQDVTGTALVKSASKTGLNVDRISRTIRARREFIRSSGVKKGTRYSLNNRGIAEAERLIKLMVE